ncbi:hypothetical protein IFO70_34765 [Phormidium tenue FACHB-886]|nr:hypothetical protein [Phormidium tenue FACHB-886]
MVQLVASDMEFTCIKNGADSFSGDDIYLAVNGFRYQPIKSFSPSGHAQFPDYFSGDNGTFIRPQGSNAPVVTGTITSGKNDFTFVANNSITFKIFDEDSFGTDGFGSFVDPNDDLIGSVSYTAKGNEPFFDRSQQVFSQPGFQFFNILTGSGAQYKLSYNITQLPGSTTGKLASKDGGIMNGSNKDGTLVGLGGKDIINANDGDNLLDGGDNSDTLNGGKGDDLIFGGKGKASDVLSGGTGSDLFVAGRNIGLDTIKDFRSGEDTIGLGNGLKFEDLSLWNRSGGTVVKAGNQQIAFLQGTNANSLSASDFSQMDIGSLNSLVKHDLAALKG